MGKPVHDEPLIPADLASRKRVIAAVLVAAVAVLIAGVGMYLPVHRALNSGGALRYYTKGVVLPPVLLYVAVLIVTVEVGDGQILAVNAKNKRALPRKGWLVVAGAVLVSAAAMLCWTMYLRALGFQSV